MVVSDTSPLRYLIAVGQADLIDKLFNQVLIPPAVREELTHPSGLPQVREWMRRPPTWLQVSDMKHQPDDELLATLDRGEGEAIQLALDFKADFLVMDERLGRALASVRGLSVIGALGILRESYRRNFVTNPVAIVDQMRSIGFRLSRQLYQEFYQQIRTTTRQ
jgi:predicted nucleic acid-binding protein